MEFTKCDAAKPQFSFDGALERSENKSTKSRWSIIQIWDSYSDTNDTKMYRLHLARYDGGIWNQWFLNAYDGDRLLFDIETRQNARKFHRDSELPKWLIAYNESIGSNCFQNTSRADNNVTRNELLNNEILDKNDKKSLWLFYAMAGGGAALILVCAICGFYLFNRFHQKSKKKIQIIHLIEFEEKGGHNWESYQLFKVAPVLNDRRNHKVTQSIH